MIRVPFSREVGLLRERTGPREVFYVPPTTQQKNRWRHSPFRHPGTRPIGSRRFFGSSSRMDSMKVAEGSGPFQVRQEIPLSSSLSPENSDLSADKEKCDQFVKIISTFGKSG
ncbi:hypothetical protein CDAR_474051 [Caerostris darwini]|uniref:Uncharacterized protein n=1 Tax=Caerostris darwini TaxID=1538125 RepID=A0AAV4SJT0_9ARAC|nr:hypothetical protein CDAR_474051 [Caerostris darwini]